MIKNFSVRYLKPELVYSDIDYNANDFVLIPYKVSFELHGDTVNESISNAIRITLMSELPIKVMHIEFEDFETNDGYLYDYSLISQVVSSIPVMQTVPDNTVFRLHAQCLGSDRTMVKSSQIIGAAQYVDQGIEMFALNPQRHINLKKIIIRQGFGHENGKFVSAFSATSVPLMNKKSFVITFMQNGTIPPKKILTNALQSLVSRLKSVLSMVGDFKEQGSYQTLRVESEKHSIGYLISRTMINMNEDLEYCVAQVSETGRYFNLHVKHADPAAITAAAIKEAISVYEGALASINNIN